MALTDASQQALVDQALARAKAQGISEADAQKTIASTLQKSGYSVQNGKLVKGQSMTAVPATNAPATTQPVAVPPAQPVQPAAPTPEPAPVIPAVVKNETPAPVVPAAPVPAAPKAPETPKAPSVSTAAGPVSTERATQIAQNLTEGTKATPELFKDRQTYNQAYGYDTKPENEKALLDAAWNNVQPKADQLFNQLATGQISLSSVPKNAQGNLATYRFNAVQRYKNYTPSQLATALTKSRDILFGSQAYLDLEKANPQLVAQANEIRKNSTFVGILSGEMDSEDVVSYTNATGALDSLISSDMKSSGVKSIADIIAELEDASGTKAKKDKMATVQADLTQDINAYNALEDDIDKELSGTGATESYKRALLATRGKSILNAITSKKDVIDQLKGQISDDLKMAEFAYNERKSQIATKQAKQDKLTEMRFQLYRDEQSRKQQLAYLDAQNKSALELAKAKQQLEGKNLKEVDLGGSIALINPSTGAVVKTFSKSQTPDQSESGRYMKAGDNVMFDTKTQTYIPMEQVANAPIAFGRTDVGNPNVQTQYTGTGEIVPFTVSQFYKDAKGNVVEREKTVQMDSSIQGKFTAAMNELMRDTPAGVIIADTYRNEEQQAGKVAQGVSWTMDSSHRKGLAVDLYAGNASIGDAAAQKEYLTKYVAPIMAKYGFEQKHFGKGDYGNFEYTGVGQAEQNANSQLVDDNLAKTMLVFGQNPGKFKAGTADERSSQQKLFMDAYKRGDMDTIKAFAIDSLPTKERDAYTEAYNRTAEIPNIMKAFSDLSKSGVKIDFTTPYQQTLNNLSGSADPRAQLVTKALAPAMEFMAKVRNELFGAALTEIESDKAKPFIIEVGDSLPMVMNKLASMQSYAAKAVARRPFVAMGMTPEQLVESEYVNDATEKLSRGSQYVTFEKANPVMNGNNQISGFKKTGEVISMPTKEYLQLFLKKIQARPEQKDILMKKAKEDGIDFNDRSIASLIYDLRNQ